MERDEGATPGCPAARHGGAPGEDPRIRAAYEYAALSYDAARAEVYSRYPAGVPAAALLSQRERELVDEVERAHATLKRLRQDRIARSQPGPGLEDDRPCSS